MVISHKLQPQIQSFTKEYNENQPESALLLTTPFFILPLSLSLSRGPQREGVNWFCHIDGAYGVYGDL